VSNAIRIDSRDLAEVKALLNRLGKDETNKAMARAINATLPGVRTDGVRILSEHYALTASAIRESWKIRKALFRDPFGVVSTQGTFIRLARFGAKQTKTGVSVKVLKKNPRAVIEHAFLARAKKGQREEQVYWRKYKGPRKPLVRGRAYAKMEFLYRFPIEALYGPRVQDKFDDPVIMGTVQNLAAERLTKNMAREVDSIMKGY